MQAGVPSTPAASAAIAYVCNLFMSSLSIAAPARFAPVCRHCAGRTCRGYVPRLRVCVVVYQAAEHCVEVCRGSGRSSGSTSARRRLPSQHASDQFGAIAAFGLFEHPADVVLDRRRRDVEPFGDLVEMISVEQQRQHLDFARRDMVSRSRSGQRIRGRKRSMRTPMNSPAGPDIGCVRTTRNGTGARRRPL